MNLVEYNNSDDDSIDEDYDIDIDEISEWNESENENGNESYYNVHDSPQFETGGVFSSREELINWVQAKGLSKGIVIVIKRSKNNSVIYFQCDRGCEAEVDMFKSHYQKQSNAGKRSVLKKLKDIFTPWSTSVREPITKKNMRDRPSFRKPHVDPPPQTQEPRINSCSSALPFSDQNAFNYQNNFSHQYIHQTPNFFHPFITHMQDVKSDGNCGFRSIALCRGLHENDWPMVPRSLMDELSMYENEYVYMFTREHYNHIYATLNFFDVHEDAPFRNWMNMPEMGSLIASNYNVILHVIDMTCSTTYFPLRSTPPAWYQHEVITIGYVNNNHYIKVTLTGGYPFSTISPQWVHFKYDCAAVWATPYSKQINTYNRCLRNLFNHNN